MQKLLLGYQEIKRKGFVHRDLKTCNVMLHDGQPLIIDFGYCEKNGSQKPQVFYNVGSPSYMSPEAYFKTLYSEKSDLWALGVILFEMLEGHTIDQGLPINRYFADIIRKGFQLPLRLSEKTRRLLFFLFQINPDQRSNTDQALAHIAEALAQFQQNPHPQRASMKANDRPR